ncbi:MAG: hypothetical protein HY909_09990 [Deltaproteobacteria bacterium]|nr:hypothetical protein [Deltaproteobacteria bacterium]
MGKRTVAAGRGFLAGALVVLAGGCGGPSGAVDGLTIVSYEVPPEVLSDSAATRARLTWSGDAVFPVTIRSSVTFCDSNLTCSGAVDTVASASNPIVLRGPFCTNIRAPQRYRFGFSVRMTDANGVQSNAFPWAFTCVGR